MTELRCTCGAVLDGVGEELLDAVEVHLDEVHRGRVPAATGAPAPAARPLHVDTDSIAEDEQ